MRRLTLHLKPFGTLFIAALLALELLSGGAAKAGVPCGRETMNYGAVFSPDSTQVAFLSGGSGGCLPLTGKVLVANVADGQARVIDQGPANLIRWSPDGRELALQLVDQSNRSSIAITDIVSGDQHVLGAGAFPTWAPDSSLLAFARADGVFVAPAGGSGPVTRLGTGGSPSWSPISLDKIAAIDHGVVVYARDGSEHRLTSVYATGPLIWSPDGSAIVFNSLPSSGNDEIDVVGLDGTMTHFPSGGEVSAWVSRGLLVGESHLADPQTGNHVQTFPDGIPVSAIAPNGAATALEETPNFVYGGSDLYLGDPQALHQRRISPSRCDGQPGCQIGTDGPDRLVGSEAYNRYGSNQIYGGAGNDVLIGAVHADRLDGAFGADTILGGSGNDIVDGGPGSDRISGGDGIDFIYGGSGNDLIKGGARRDYLSGGTGDDTIIATDGGWHDTVDCGLGSDTVRADPADQVDLSSCEHVTIVRRLN